MAAFLSLAAKALCPGQRKDQIGHNIADDASVDVGSGQLRIQIGEEIGEASNLHKRGHGNENVYKDDQHDKLQHIGIHNTKQSGGGGIQHEHYTSNDEAR